MRKDQINDLTRRVSALEDDRDDVLRDWASVGEGAEVSTPTEADPRGSVIAMVKNCSASRVPAGHVLQIQRWSGDRAVLAAHYTRYFDPPADPTPPADPSQPPPVSTRIHSQEDFGEFQLADPPAGYGPLERTPRRDLEDEAEPVALGVLPPSTEPIYDDEAGVNAARGRLDRKLAMRPIAVALDAIEAGATGRCVIGFWCRGWVYLSNVNHQFCGPYRGEQTRVKTLEAYRMDRVVGHLGRYDTGPGYDGNPLFGDADPDGLTEAFIGDPRVLYSADAGPVRIVRAYRRDRSAAPTLPNASIKKVGDYARRVSDDGPAVLLPMVAGGGLAGSTVVVVLTGEEIDTGGAAQPSIDIANMTRVGWRLLLDTNTKITGATNTYWLHRAAFVAPIRRRRTDPFWAYFLDRTADSLNRHAAVVEFRGADVNKVAAVDATSPNDAARVSTTGEVYSMLQVSHFYRNTGS